MPLQFAGAIERDIGDIGELIAADDGFTKYFG